jgi:hypothetical protein
MSVGMGNHADGKVSPEGKPVFRSRGKAWRVVGGGESVSPTGWKRGRTTGVPTEPSRAGA